RTYEMTLPKADCGVHRSFRVVATDPSARVESAPRCIAYCSAPITIEVNEYQPKNSQIVFFHVNQQGERKETARDWIEIHNYGDQPVDIREMGLASAKAIKNGKAGNWLFGKDAKVTEPLPAGGFFFVLADNDDGSNRTVYHLVSDPTGHLNNSCNSSGDFFSTRFKLDPTPKAGDPPDSFSLVAKMGEQFSEVDQVILNFSQTPYVEDQSSGRFDGENHAPNALMPGTVTSCPTPCAPNQLICQVDLAPSFEKVVTRDTAGPTRCPAPGEAVTVHARIKFDSDVTPSEMQVELLYRLEETGVDTHVPMGPDLTVSPAEDQSNGGFGAKPFDVTAKIPGQPDKTLVIFSLVAKDSKRGEDMLTEETVPDGSSFRYVVGYELPADHPVISEVLPGNDTIFVPPDANVEAPKHPDFAEIFNPANVP